MHGIPSSRGELDAVLRVVDVLLPLGRVGMHEVLVDREHGQGEAVAEGRLLEAVHVGRRLVRHLPVQDLDALEAEGRRLLDHLLDRVLLRLEVPVGVGGDREADPRGPTPGSGRAWARRDAAGKSGGRDVPSCRACRRVRVMGSLRFRRRERLLAGQEAVEARDHVLQVRGVAALDLGRDPAVVADLGEGLAHLGPVHVALAEVLPGERPLLAVELEVLDVDAGDPRPEGADPVLRIAVEEHVAHVEVGLHPGRGELVDVARHLERAQEELVPDLLDARPRPSAPGRGAGCAP